MKAALIAVWVVALATIAVAASLCWRFLGVHESSIVEIGVMGYPSSVALPSAPSLLTDHDAEVRGTRQPLVACFVVVAGPLLATLSGCGRG